VSQTRSNAGEEVDGVSDGDEQELEDAVDETSKPSRAERKAAKRRAKRDRASGGSSDRTFRGPRAMQVHDAAAAPGALQRRGSPGAACVVRCAVHGEDRACRD
jgi:hypothetical protein